MMSAVLSNPSHPKYGVATIPFPIPRDQYTYCMDLLEALEIGDAVTADCKVEKVDSFYTVLKRVEMLTVNVEELNYLAKRLDSFDTGEAAQFLAMAHKLELFELKDLINLTFCCQQATVITDFSDLAAIGRDHYMNLHGGSASVDELNALDDKGTARQLIESGSGTVTPYGVVYDNGMKLEPIYQGREFPCYYYKPNAITVAATSKAEPEDTEHITWLFLPMVQEEIDRALLRGGITDSADVRLRLEDSQLPNEVDVLLDMEYETLSDLNALAQATDGLSKADTVQGIILGSVSGRKCKSKGGILLQTSHKLLEKLRRPVEGKRKTKKKSKALSKVKKMIEEQRDIRALVDSDDVHCLMIGASGVGKTAFFLYPNLEYACACGMSYLALDTKGDLARNYGCIASKYYGYQVTVIDLRNPTCSDGFNFMTLVNHYMDRAKRDPNDLTAKAKAENYAKILAKTIINPDGDAAQYGENAFFYDSAEGLLTAIVLLLAEFAPPKDGEPEKRHIVSAFKLVQDLLAVPKSRGKNGFQQLMDELPPEHKARWLAGAALTSADQSMASVMSTVMSRLNAFLDTELEQVICYDSPINAEMFASEKCAIFLILPEEYPAKNFIAALMIQNLSRELFSVADETGGRLKNRVVLFCDELGTMPPFDILPLFSAGRSRRLTLVPIIQSLAQLEKNYGKEGAEIICDNCQDTIFGGFSPQSKTADALSAALGSRTVLSGSVSQGKESSQSLQMIERPLMTPDELKSVPKGEFVVMKTGAHLMRTRLRLFLDWGITFEKDCPTPKPIVRRVAYAGCEELIANIRKQYTAEKTPYNAMRGDKR